MITLNEQQKQILSFISKYGCADVYQIYQIMAPYKQDLTQLLIDAMLKANYIDLVHGHYLVIKDHPESYNIDTINCIWAMIKFAHSREDIIESMIGVSPAKVFLTVDNKYSFEIIPVSEAKIANIRKIQEKMLAKFDKSKNLTYSYIVFVVASKDIIKTIRNCEFSFPYVVAFIESYDEYGQPIIKLIKNNPSTEDK